MAVALPEVIVGQHHVDTKMGVSWFTGNPESSNGLSELWLPTQSFDVVEQLQEHGGVTLIGEVGSGKSTLLYGARAVMRVQGIPYVTINGHYKNVSSDEIIDVIDAAQQEGFAIVYDSADYLVGGHRRTRALPMEEHLGRNLAIMEKLIAFRQNGGRLLMTSHNESWINDTAHPNLLGTWNELIGLTAQDTVDIRLENPEERSRFLQKIGLDPQLAGFIAALPNNPNFSNYIVHKWGDKRYLDRIQTALTRYPLLKLMGRDNYGENTRLLDAARKTASEGIDEEQTWEEVVNFIHSKMYLLTFFTKL